MRNIIEQHQPRADGIFKIQNIQAGRCLIEPVAVTAHIKPSKAADDDTQGGFMRNDNDISIFVIHDHFTNYGQSARQYSNA